MIRHRDKTWTLNNSAWLSFKYYENDYARSYHKSISNIDHSLL